MGKLVAGAALSLAITLLVQFFAIPYLDRSRRWEIDLRELGELVVSELPRSIEMLDASVLTGDAVSIRAAEDHMLFLSLSRLDWRSSLVTRRLRKKDRDSLLVAKSDFQKTAHYYVMHDAPEDIKEKVAVDSRVALAGLATAVNAVVPR